MMRPFIYRDSQSWEYWYDVKYKYTNVAPLRNFFRYFQHSGIYYKERVKKILNKYVKRGLYTYKLKISLMKNMFWIYKFAWNFEENKALNAHFKLFLIIKIYRFSIL